MPKHKTKGFVYSIRPAVAKDFKSKHGVHNPLRSPKYEAECRGMVKKHSGRDKKSHREPATKSDLKALEKIIMTTAQQLIDASTTLSTSADALSSKVDTLSTKTDALVTAAEAVVVALQGSSLPPGADAALAKLQASATAADAASTAAAATGDKLDAEVAKLDTLLPTPAPAGPTA